MQPAVRRGSLLGTGLVQQDWAGADAGAVGAQQQQQLGYGQNEHAHMLTAIRQPLFIQTPLQVMLETLVEKLQLQADATSGIQNRIEALEHNRLTGGELLSRIQLLEGRMDAVAALTGMGADAVCTVQGPGVQPGSKEVSAASGPTSSDTTNTTSSSSSSRPENPGSGSGRGSLAAGGAASLPFIQAKLVRQVATLEQQAAVLQESSVQLTFKTEQVLLPRLQQCERVLAGVSALAGSLNQPGDMAMYLAGSTAVHTSQLATPAGQDMYSKQMHEQQQQQQQDVGIQLLQALRGEQHQQQQRQQQLQEQIDAGKQHAAAAQQHLQHLQQQVDRASADACATQDQQLGVLAGLQDGLSGLSERIDRQVTLLRRETKPALQATEQQQLSASELVKTQRLLETLEGKQSALAKELASLKAKEFAELAGSVAQLSRRVARVTGAPGGLSDTERALAAAQAELRGQLDGLAARLASHELTAACIATQQNLQDLSNQEHHRSSEGDLRAVVNRAVALALQQQAHSAANRDDSDDADAAAASRTRCLVCDRALRDTSPQQQRCNTAPAQHQQQLNTELLLPIFESFRPATAAPQATHSGLSPPHATAAAGNTSSSSSNSTYHSNRSGSPGRRPGGCSGTFGGSGTSSGAGTGPRGPGLQTAQLRQMSAAQKAGRGGTSGVNRSSSSSSSGRDGRPSSSKPAAAAAAAAHGILGLRPMGGAQWEHSARPGSAAAAAAGMLAPGPGGLFVGDLVSSNLRISPAAGTTVHVTAAAAAAAEGDTETGGEGTDAAEKSEAGAEASFTNAHAAASVDTVQQQQQQQQQRRPVTGKSAATAAGVRPQTACVSGCDSKIPAVRPSTAAAAAAAAAGAAGVWPGTAACGQSGHGSGDAVGRTPVFL